MNYLLIKNEAENKKESKQFCSFIEAAKDRTQCLDAIKKLNLFNSVTFKTRTAFEFGEIILQNYARREGNVLHYEFINDTSLNTSYTIIKL
jgi:hypothetical protein